MIIGLTGLNCAGKGSVAELLKKKGFKYHSLSDAIRDDMRHRKIKITRDNMIATGKELRSKQGDGVLAEMTKLKIPWKQNAIVDSIRHPAEIEALQMRKDFFLVCVDAPSKVRFARMKKRKRESDATTYSAFVAQEKKEMQTEGSGQQLGVCVRMAKIKIINDGNLKKLSQKLNKLLIDIRKQEKKTYAELKTIRPAWDEYFMDLALKVGERGTCNRGKAGTVIVKDKRIVTTGYVGSPVGLPHCDEVGHQFKKVIHEDGHVSEHCVRTIHAEQNAICQAAKYGISLSGATIYVNMTPCAVCARMIINSGIKRVVANKFYHAGTESIEMFKQAGVKYEQISEEMQKYDKM